jgi:hypothetical protein
VFPNFIRLLFSSKAVGVMIHGRATEIFTASGADFYS